MANEENSISKFLDEIGLGILWGKIKGLIYDEDGTNKFTKLATLIGINTTDISKRAYKADAEGATTTNSYVKKADSATNADTVDNKHASDFATATQGTNADNHRANKNNPHEVTKAQIGLSNVTNDAQVKRTEMGVANGVATLDTDGKVPTSQLPSYVDDVVEYDSKSAFPATGEAGKIYVAKDTNLTYRWGGSAYVEISPTLALGETSSTAYRGDRGAVAYNHSQTAHAPSNAQKNVQSDWNVTDNTSDAYIRNKPTMDDYVKTADLTSATAIPNSHVRKADAVDMSCTRLTSADDLNCLWLGDFTATPPVSYESNKRMSPDGGTYSSSGSYILYYTIESGVVAVYQGFGWNGVGCAFYDSNNRIIEVQAQIAGYFYVPSGAVKFSITSTANNTNIKEYQSPSLLTSTSQNTVERYDWITNSTPRNLPVSGVSDGYVEQTIKYNADNRTGVEQIAVLYYLTNSDTAITFRRTKLYGTGRDWTAWQELTNTSITALTEAEINAICV